MKADKKNNTEKRVLKVIRAFLVDLDNRPAIDALNLDASIEDDLGIDSIGRAEILRLLEKEFSVTIDDQQLLAAETINDVVNAVNAAKPVTSSKQKATVQQAEGLILPKRANTLLQVLEHYVDLDKDKVHVYLQQDNAAHEITYGDVYENSQRVAQGLIALGVERGDTIAIMLPTSEAFFYAFFGILYAGAIPIPIYPPVRAQEIENYVKNEANILANAEVRVLITFEKGKPISNIIKNFIPTLRKVTTVDRLKLSEKKRLGIRIKADDPVLIQYTSGSTGKPKGVLLQHRSLLTNLRTIGETIHFNEKDVIVSWLPLYHDMGLIGAWLGSLYYGVPLVLHSPLAFLVRPQRWLWSIHRYKGTISASPNFGYEFCTHKIADKDIEGLDLHSWRLALNGAEAIHAETIRNFVKKFKAYQFDPTAIYPVYGLAESTVALSFPEIGEGIRVERLDRDIFAKECRAKKVADDHKEFVEFVSCGKPLPRHEIRIVDEQGNELAERQVGYVQFRGPSTMQGYYNNREASKAIYHDGWWDTGDMGYIADDEFFPTGRKKDLIIKAGRNFYPEDIEYAVGDLSAVRKGSVVALGVSEAESGTEKMVVVAEVHDKKLKDRHKIISEIRQRVKQAIGIPPDKVLLVPPKTIPKTSSGKLKRSDAKKAYLHDELKPIGTPIWIQLIKLSLRSLRTRLLRWTELLLRYIYTAYAAVVLIIFLIPLWTLLFLLPKKINGCLTKWGARAILWLSGCPLKVKGRQYIKKGEQYIYVSNHTSFADSLVLLAVLSSDIKFLGKQELLNVPFLKTFIKKLGHLTTTREDFLKGEQAMKKVNKVLRRGDSLLVYPEGTFTYSRGVRHFKLGAFTMAVENGIAVCPIALKGVRDIQRGNSMLLRPNKITVTIQKPIDTTKPGWSLVTKVRDKTRAIIAKYSGEEEL